MLIMAAAADPEIGTRSRNAFGRGLFYLQQPRMQLVGRLDEDAFPGQNERRQHDAAVVPRQAVAAVHEFFYCESKWIRHDRMVFS
jgi:hypothetical protein